MLRLIGRNSARVGAGSILAAFTGAWYYRPLASNEDGSMPDRSKHWFCSTINPYTRDSTPFILSVARGLSISITTIAIRLFMNSYGSYELDTNDDNYIQFLNSVLGSDRKSGQGIITVSNHRSLFDDPGVVSCILPLWVGIQPKYNRWGICSQEYCFNDVLPGIIKGYIGAGQVLPICRGCGINQSLLLDFARHLAAGDWCHIFPEGRISKGDQLGGRNGCIKTKGKLKWGVGKLIAHAPVCPKVFPFAHVGMEHLFVTDTETGRDRLKKNILAGEPLHVRIKFGKEIQFDDLIDEYESKHGKLRKYSSDSENNTDQIGWTASSDDEKQLYRKITLRIEQELETITQTVVLKNHESSTNQITTKRQDLS